MVNELDYVLENHCSRERLQQTTGDHDYEAGDLRKTPTLDDKLKRPLVRKGTHVLRKCFSGENQGRQCWRQSIAKSETQV